MSTNRSNLPVSSTGTRRGFTSRGLLKAIFDSDNPEEITRSLPAQSLYLAVRQAGLSSSTDLLLLASVEQFRVLLDIDCWKRDSFNEDHFWEWLALGDDEDGLRLLQRVLQSLDLKLLGLLIARYVEVVTFDEPTDAPPAPGYYTPDRGYTWLNLKLEDPTRHYLLGRLLAMLFETSANLFYQILATPTVATESMLEEEAFGERSKRLSSEGIPEPSLAAEYHAPLPLPALHPLIVADTKTILSRDIPPIQPLVYDSSTPQPLGSLIEDSRLRDAIESELTFLMNAAVVHFGTDITDPANVVFLSEKVKGALNIGLQRVTALSSDPLSELIARIGCAPFYRHGLTYLIEIRSLSRRIQGVIERSPRGAEDIPPPEGLPALAISEALLALSSPFPHAPAFLLQWLQNSTRGKALKPNELDTNPTALQREEDCTLVKDWLAQLSANR